MSTEVPAIFWRFKTDYSEVPEPEQADYEFDEPLSAGSEPGYRIRSVPLYWSRQKPWGEPLEQNSAFQHLAASDLQVEEISMGEFDGFLKGASRNEKKDEQK